MAKVYRIQCQVCDLVIGYAMDSLNSFMCKDCNKTLQLAAKREPKMRKFEWNEIPYIREYWQQIVAKHGKKKQKKKK